MVHARRHHDFDGVVAYWARRMESELRAALSGCDDSLHGQLDDQSRNTTTETGEDVVSRLTKWLGGPLNDQLAKELVGHPPRRGNKGGQKARSKVHAEMV